MTHSAIHRATWWAARSLAAAAVLAAASAGGSALGDSGLPNAHFKTYDTPYYILYTDQDPDMVREASVRMTCMGEAYTRRCMAFGGAIQRKFPFYMFKNAGDYYQFSGAGSSAGCYIFNRTGGRLLARSDPEIGDHVWHTVQHEGFHQFVHMVIGGEIPIAINEGLAEYFGHGIWTGDDLLCGAIPPERLWQVQVLIKANRMSAWQDFFPKTPLRWGDMGDYDEAWSIVQFLVHADDGKYQKPFVGMIADMAKRTPWDKAFVKWLGRDIDGLEKHWRQWWTDLPPDPTRDLYDQATVETLTSFLARASMRGMKFETADAFFAAARDGRLIVDPKNANVWNWLPPSLLETALKDSEKLGQWSVTATPPAIAVKRPDGKTFTGTYVLPRNARPKVMVTIK